MLIFSIIYAVYDPSTRTDPRAYNTCTCTTDTYGETKIAQCLVSHAPCWIRSNEPGNIHYGASTCSVNWIILWEAVHRPNVPRTFPWFVVTIAAPYCIFLLHYFATSEPIIGHRTEMLRRLFLGCQSQHRDGRVSVRLSVAGTRQTSLCAEISTSFIQNYNSNEYIMVKLRVYRAHKLDI